MLSRRRVHTTLPVSDIAAARVREHLSEAGHGTSPAVPPTRRAPLGQGLPDARDMCRRRWIAARRPPGGPLSVASSDARTEYARQPARTLSYDRLACI
jgi:hypothetical protein